MIEYTKEDLISILSNYDFSHVDLAEIPGKQYQPAGRKVNIEEYKKFIASYQDIFKDKKDFIRFLLDLREHTLEEIVDNAMCPICGKFVHVMEMHSGKRHTCKEHWGQYMKILYEQKTGYKDPYSNPDVIKKRKENFINKYGVEHPMQLKEIQEKRIQTDLQNHNGKLYCQTKEGKQQIMQTNLYHHGGVFNLNTEYAKNRLKEVCQEKFGTDNPLQCKEVREIKNNDYLTELRLEGYLKKIFPKNKFIHELKIKNFKPDYCCEELKLIVEFDGIDHYSKTTVVQSDQRKDSYLSALGYKIVRIPFFIQMSSQIVKLLFGLEIDIDQVYPHGFISDKTINMMPASFCPLGLKRFFSDLKRFSCVKENILNSLDMKAKKFGDETVYPIGNKELFYQMMKENLK